MGRRHILFIETSPLMRLRLVPSLMRIILAIELNFPYDPMVLLHLLLPIRGQPWLPVLLILSSQLFLQEKSDPMALPCVETLLPFGASTANWWLHRDRRRIGNGLLKETTSMLVRPPDSMAKPADAPLEVKDVKFE